MMNAQDVQDALQVQANAQDAVLLQRFFKTGPGQYGEHDIFIGVRVPKTRVICKQFRSLPLPELKKLLGSKVHEHRLAALIIMTLEYPRGNSSRQEALYELYVTCAQRGYINNWDLVDVSAEYIVGTYLTDRPKDIIYEFAKSKDVWLRRIAVMSTFAYIKNSNAQLTLKLSELLLHDPHDLIQKAVGWMLREVGKRCDEKLLISFLDAYAHEMPRTMLRYAIERLPAEQRRYYMAM